MYRGQRTFVCTDCGEKFEAPDFEFCATVYSVPQPCPKCKGTHTRPRDIFSFLNTYAYKGIWKMMEREKENSYNL